VNRRQFLAASGALIASGCSSATHELRFVVIPKGLTHQHWQSVHRGALRAARDIETEYQQPVRIIWDGPLREKDALAQIRIVDRRVSTRVDGIVLAPQHSQTMVAPVRRAVENGIPVVVIDSGLEQHDLFVKYVATDNYNGGRLAAEHLLRVLRDSGNSAPRIVMFRYAIGSESTEQREKGFEDFIDKAIEQQRRLNEPEISWLSRDKYAGATVDSAQREAFPLINSLVKADGSCRIDGIFAPNESSANGVMNVLRQLGLSRRVRLMGFDSSEPLLQAVESGEIDGLILQDPYRMGYVSVWTLYHYRRGEFDVQSEGQVFSTGEYLITRQNVHAPETIALFNPEMQAKRPSEGNSPVALRKDIRWSRKS
jgi:ribose transport system substrate-binding protein